MTAVPTRDRWLLRGDRIIPGAFDEVIHDGAILVEGGRIESVGPYAAVRQSYPLVPVREGKGLTALPGLVDSHSHGRALSLATHEIDPRSLELFFMRIPAMSRVDPHDDALVAGADLISTGVTAAQVFFHSLGGADPYYCDATDTLSGLRQSGIRVAFVVGITERDELLPAALLTDLSEDVPRDLVVLEHSLSRSEFFEVFDRLHATSGDGRNRDVEFVLGPGAPQWCSGTTLLKVGELMQGGIRAQTHLLETRLQRSPAYGRSPVAKLASAGVLNRNLSAAHGVWLNDDEVALLAADGVTLVHCPSSNARLRAGTARVRVWLDAGIKVGLGLDSNSEADPPDVFGEIRRVREVATTIGTEISAREALALATSGGAAALGLEDRLGVLRAGAMADIVFLTLPDMPDAEADEVADVVERATRGAVISVWVAGQEVFADGRHRRAPEVARARARMLVELARDKPLRRERLRRISAAEPWSSAAWDQLDRNVDGAV